MEAMDRAGTVMVHDADGIGTVANGSGTTTDGKGTTADCTGITNSGTGTTTGGTGITTDGGGTNNDGTPTGVPTGESHVNTVPRGFAISTTAVLHYDRSH